MKPSVESLIKMYLKEARFMQIATVFGNQPWSCTVYYASDERMHLYWISVPSTRHSIEISLNPNVAVSIPVKFDNLTVIGIQLLGHAALVEESLQIKKGVTLYSDKFNRGDDWLNNFLQGKNEHSLYHIVPHSFVLFDRVHFPNDSRKEWTLT